MLVVVEHRNIQLLFQTGLYLKAFGGSDILQIHTAEAGGDGLYSLDDLFSVLGIQADGEGIYVSKFLKQDRLSLHHRHSGLRPDVSQPQNGGSVGDHGHQVSLGRIFIYFLFVCMDLPARLGNPRRISGAQIVPCVYRHLAPDLDLTFVLCMEL